jgi:hypothetical protein
MLRNHRVRQLARHLQSVIEKFATPQDITIVWDIDPMHLG